MRLWLAILAATPACGFKTGATPIDAMVVEPDVAIDAMIDAPPPDAMPVCFGTIAPVCFNTAPTGAFTVTAATQPFSSDDPAKCNQTHDHPDLYCVLVGTTFTIEAGATLRVFGNKPLVLIATTGLFAVAGQIDVGSKQGTNQGAGANPADCVAGVEATMTSGGYGGSFGGKGGNGLTSEGTGGSAPAAVTAFPSKLRGGCRGGDGAGTTHGNGGNGGGAVAIVAPAQVTISGKINASGAGGHRGGADECGGGGGGSGGMIVIESPLIVLAGAPALFANGGSGAQGGSTGGEGADGSESAGPFTPATGGKNAKNGGGGANGSSGTGNINGDPASNGPGPDGGGGGGGGASGFIRAPGATGATGGAIAPLSSPP